MKKDKPTFLELVIKFFTNNYNKKINAFIINNAWIIPGVYILGTLALLVRNTILKLPFYSISLSQCAVIVFYTLFFLLIFMIIEIDFRKIGRLTTANLKGLVKIKCIFKTLIAYFGYIISFFIILYFSFKVEFTSSVLLSFLLLILSPTFYIFSTNDLAVFISKFVMMLFAIFVIMYIPISIGGFKGIKVTYHDSESEKDSSFTYYGINDGLYQFSDSENNILLIPVGNGYLKYNKKNR